MEFSQLKAETVRLHVQAQDGQYWVETLHTDVCMRRRKYESVGQVLHVVKNAAGLLDDQLHHVK